MTKKNKTRNRKYIFVVGGVMSGVGKGITTASLGQILKSMGYNVCLSKVDPYLNVDAGRMNPTEHGEVFVINSGLETDQDMGNYERFLNRDLENTDYLTSGMIYRDIIEKERNYGFGGKCVEAIPDIRDEIINRYKKTATSNDADISIIEIGGTVGDYQNIMFLEAARVLQVQKPNDVRFIMVSYLPIPGKLGEMKTRPTQNAVRQLNSYGIQANFIVARSEVPLDDKRKKKLATTCSIPYENIVSAPDIDSVYDVPLNFEKDNFGKVVTKNLGLQSRKPKMEEWQKFVDSRKKSKEGGRKVKIAIIGKYFDTGEFVLSDSYLSVIEAVKYSSYSNYVNPEIVWINSKKYDKNPDLIKELKDCGGIIVPGNFDDRHIDGMIAVVKYARENKIPYLGLCYGMQLLVIEYAKNVIRMKETSSDVIKKNDNLGTTLLSEISKQQNDKKNPKLMKLGEHPVFIKKGTIAHSAYQAQEILERHRHRYEINNKHTDQLVNSGLVISGTSPDNVTAEIIELPKKIHPFMLGTQFHPEFKARPLSPHPLFTQFIKAVIKK